MEFEGRSEFAYQLSQLTIGVRSDMPGLVELRYRNPIIDAPQQVFRVIQTCTWEPSRNLLNVSLFQDLQDHAYARVDKLRKEKRTLVGGTEEMMPTNCHRSSQKV
jgi:hypothetical protein